MALLHLSPFLSPKLAIAQVPAVSPELVAQLPLLGFLYSLVQLIHASEDLLHVRHPSTPSALPALTTARRSVPLPRLPYH